MSTNSHTIPLATRKLAAVGYVPLLGAVVLYGHHRNRFIFQHALQGVLLSFYFFGAYFLPSFGAYLALLIAGGLVAGFIHALAGEDFPLLGVHHLVTWLAAEKFQN